jgi:hypothetical protein
MSTLTTGLLVYIARFAISKLGGFLYKREWLLALADVGTFPETKLKIE